MDKPVFQPFFTTAFFLALVLFASQLAFAVSSDEAKSRASSFIEAGSDEVAQLEPYNLQRPVEFNGKTYWLIYLSPKGAPPERYSLTYLKFAVSDDLGTVVRDEEILRTLFLHDYKYDLENSFLKNEKLSYADLQFSLEALQENIATAKSTFSGLEASVDKRDHSIALEDKLAAISQSLDDLSNKAANLKESNVRNGLDFEKEFSQTSLVTSFDSAISNYNTSFEALLDFLDQYENYRLLTREQETYALLTSEEASAMQRISNLEPQTPSFPFSKNLLGETVSEFNNRLGKEAEDTVSNSVASTLHRIAKINAQDAYKARSRTVETEIANSQQYAKEYDACGLKDRAFVLKQDWETLTAIVQGKTPATTADFEDVPRNASKAEADAQSIKESLENCVSKPTPTPKPQDDAGLTNIAAAVLVILLAIFLYRQYKKSQQQVDLDE